MTTGQQLEYVQKPGTRGRASTNALFVNGSWSSANVSVSSPNPHPVITAGTGFSPQNRLFGYSSSLKSAPANASAMAPVTVGTDFGESPQALEPNRRSRIDASDILSRPQWLPAARLLLRKVELLEPNWDMDGAPAIAPDAILTAEALVSWFALSAVPPPDIFPTVVGGIQLEWHIFGLDAELEISASGREIEALYHDLRTGVSWQRQVSPSLDELVQVHRRLLTRNA
jgi:hypothetical protein